VGRWFLVALSVAATVFVVAVGAGCGGNSPPVDREAQIAIDDAQPPPRPQPWKRDGGKRPPNVLVFYTDDQPLRVIDNKSMPFLSGRKDWLEFTRASAHFPLCCPARANVLSGQYSSHTKVQSNPQSVDFDDRTSIQEWMVNRGYRTGLIGKYFNPYPWKRGNTYIPPGWDTWSAFIRHSRHYNYTLNVDGDVREFGDAPEDYSLKVLTEQAKQFISSSKQPFFLYFAPPGTHAPFQPAPEDKGKLKQRPLPGNFAEPDASDKPEWIRNWPIPDEAKAKKLRRRYRLQREMSLSLDRSLEEMFDTLRKQGELRRTIVIFSSDQGLANGSHRFGQKICPYQECVATPLLIRGPGVEPGESGAVVSNVDIAPTIAELTGAKPLLDVDGRSMMPLLTGERGHLPGDDMLMHAVARRDMPTWFAVRTKDYKLIAYESGEVELYDLAQDPLELDNVYGEPDYQRTGVEMRARLIHLLRESRWPRAEWDYLLGPLDAAGVDFRLKTS
jgi:N-acetylglucosamine-6-sulfatase